MATLGWARGVATTRGGETSGPLIKSDIRTFLTTLAIATVSPYTSQFRHIGQFYSFYSFRWFFFAPVFSGHKIFTVVEKELVEV